jgi:hypothetical protein
MFRKITKLLCGASFVLLGQGITAQIWQSHGGNISGVIFSPKMVVSNDTVFIAYINPMNDNVEFRKSSGNTWVNIGSYSTKDDAFDLELDNDGKPLLARVQSPLVAGTFEFNLEVLKYNNGVVSVVESTSLGSGPNTNNMVDIFDLAINPSGGMGIIFRFNHSYPTLYKAKVGSGMDATWYNGDVVLAPGGNSGIKNARLMYNSKGAIILSRNETTFGGTVNALVIHAYRHSTTSSTPTSVIAPTISSSTIIEQYIEVDKFNDTLYAVATNLEQLSSIYRISLDENENVGFSNLMNLNAAMLNPRIKISSTGATYIAYNEEAGNNAPGKVKVYGPSAPNLSTENVLGNSNFNDVGNIVGDMSLALNGEDAYVIFQYGPPFNNAKVRKFACPNEPITINYNTNTGIISATGVLANGTYQWIDCDDQTALGTLSTFEPSESGSYKLTVSYGDCQVNSECINVVISGGASLDENNNKSIKLFPNPTKEKVTISNLHADDEIFIVDICGKNVFQKTAQFDQETISVSALLPGYYLVKVQSKGIEKTKPLIVE